MWPRNRFRTKPENSLDALKTSRNDLTEIRRRENNVDNVVVDMIRIRNRNHFAERLSSLMFKPRGGWDDARS